jgi:hypothetical protein
VGITVKKGVICLVLEKIALKPVQLKEVVDKLEL